MAVGSTCVSDIAQTCANSENCRPSVQGKMHHVALTCPKQNRIGLAGTDGWVRTGERDESVSLSLNFTIWRLHHTHHLNEKRKMQVPSVTETFPKLFSRDLRIPSISLSHHRAALDWKMEAREKEATTVGSSGTGVDIDRTKA